ncbi:hypothetical protein KM043_002826 [Ampulex compressa]|nr:hypothetical protein KM043_002826 [Ampulex compressa]
MDSNDTAMDPHCDCSLVGFGIVQKIPYVRSSSTCGPLNIDFSSVCIRCGMCIAIAEKINRTLLEVHESVSYGNWLNDTEAPLLLRAICDHCFEHYSLREFNGKRIISDRLPGSIFVPTSADGSWEQNLRETCHEYLDEIRELQLYRHWQKWCTDHDQMSDLTTVLCRSELGVLRDCRSVEITDGYRTMPETYLANVKITLE